MVATIHTLKKAPILGPDATPLGLGYTCSSSDTAILRAAGDGSIVWAFGVAPGLATLTAVRDADGATATLEVTVAAAPFTISLGDEVPA